MGNVLSDDKQQQVLVLGRLGCRPLGPAQEVFARERRRRQHVCGILEVRQAARLNRLLCTESVLPQTSLVAPSEPQLGGGTEIDDS
jgi:hypothetical protein